MTLCQKTLQGLLRFLKTATWALRIQLKDGAQDPPFTFLVNETFNPFSPFCSQFEKSSVTLKKKEKKKQRANKQNEREDCHPVWKRMNYRQMPQNKTLKDPLKNSKKLHRELLKQTERRGEKERAKGKSGIILSRKEWKSKNNTFCKICYFSDWTETIYTEYS